MRIRLDHIAEFYKMLVALVDSDGKLLSFRKRKVNPPSDYIATAGSTNDDDLFFETINPGYNIYNGGELIKTLHQVRSSKVDISLITEKEPGLDVDIIDVGALFHQRKAVHKLNQLAKLKRLSLVQEPVIYNSRAYSTTQISARIDFYLDLLKATRLGKEAAYHWCRQQDAAIIKMTPDILLQKTMLDQARSISYSHACRRQFSQRKNKP